MQFNESHFVNNSSMIGPFPEGMCEIFLGMGCFWELRDFFGIKKEFMLLRFVMQEALRLTLFMKKFVVA